jgi:hypothetical protein
MHSCSSIDPDDPKTAEISSFGLTVAKRKYTGSDQCFFRRSVQSSASANVTFSALEQATFRLPSC